jgi:hypothetical protein
LTTRTHSDLGSTLKLASRLGKRIAIEGRKTAADIGFVPGTPRLIDTLRDVRTAKK